MIIPKKTRREILKYLFKGIGFFLQQFNQFVVIAIILQDFQTVNSNSSHIDLKIFPDSVDFSIAKHFVVVFLKFSIHYFLQRAF